VDPSYRNGLFPCIRYNHFTQREILDGFFGTLEKLFSWDDIAGRGIRLFENGTFLRGGNDNPPFWDKLTISLMLIRRFAFSKNQHKRRLLSALFKMVRQKKLSMNDLVIFLLNMEGYNQYNLKAKAYLPEVRRAVDEIDAAIAAEDKRKGSVDNRSGFGGDEDRLGLRS
jgi:hypothetical protein